MPENTFDLLERIVNETQCKPGWEFKLIDEDGAKRLVIALETTDNYNPDRPYTDEVRPFVPMHGPGEDPYTVHEWRSEEDARTTQRGKLRDGPV